jgi:hypothetical protein
LRHLSLRNGAVGRLGTLFSFLFFIPPKQFVKHWLLRERQ